MPFAHDADPWASMRHDGDDENSAVAMMQTRRRQKSQTRFKTRDGGENGDVDENERGRPKTRAMKEEAENASLSAMAKKSRAEAKRSAKMGIVREEVDKINARTGDGAKSARALSTRTNEPGMRGDDDVRSSNDRASIHGSIESFATASVDPWGGSFVHAAEQLPSRQVAPTATTAMRESVSKKRSHDKAPLSPSRYENVPNEIGGTMTKRTKESAKASSKRGGDFGSPVATMPRPLRADTEEGEIFARERKGPELPPAAECYLGPWLGEERARLLAYEACMQTCLERSLDPPSFDGQKKFDSQTALYFFNDRCAELRRAFGLDGVLVGIGSDTPRTPEPKVRVTPEKGFVAPNALRGHAALAGAGGGRWIAITVAATEVEIIDRGLKKLTHGWDPRQHGWQRPTEARGQRMTIRTEGGEGSSDACVELSVKQAPLRLALGRDDTDFIVEIPLKTKVATAKIGLDELCRKSEVGIVELPLTVTVQVPATEQAAAYEDTYEKGKVKLSVVFETAVGAGLILAPPGAGTAPDRSTQGWAEASRALTPQAAYDFALAAALRALGFTRRRLRVHGEWEVLLAELARSHAVTETYSSLRYIQHLLAVATPTADCLALIRQHLHLALRKQAEGSLGATEGQMLNGIRSAVMTLVCICFENYKSLDECDFDGIRQSGSPVVPAPALYVSLDLFKALQRDPSSNASLEIIVEKVTSAARQCFKRNKAIEVNEKRKLVVNNKDLVMQLYVAIGDLCVRLKNELEIDRMIQNASSFPGAFSLPAVTADIYCTDVAATFKDALEAAPPPGPPCKDVLDCIERSCHLQASASLEEKEGQRLIALKLDTRSIWQPHIDGWIVHAKKRLEMRCKAVLSSKGVIGPAIDECYIAMNEALNGFERIVTRWPDQALALEQVLAGAERLLMKHIAETVEHLAIPNEDGDSTKSPHARKGNWITNIGRMKEGVASVAKRTQQMSQQVSKRLTSRDSSHNGIPPPLAAALNALKSMEIRRAEEDRVGQRLTSWAVAGGSAGADELGRVLTETLGELRAHYNGYLRRAVRGVYECGPSLRDRLVKAKPKKDIDVDSVVAPILTYIDGIRISLDRKLPQRRALVGVLRGLWDTIGAECLAFYEEDLRTNSTWHKRVLASAAVELVSEKIESIIREFLVHDAHDKDVEPPQSVAKLGAYNSGNVRESFGIY